MTETTESYHVSYSHYDAKVHRTECGFVQRRFRQAIAPYPSKRKFWIGPISNKEEAMRLGRKCTGVTGLYFNYCNTCLPQMNVDETALISL